MHPMVAAVAGVAVVQILVVAVVVVQLLSESVHRPQIYSFDHVEIEEAALARVFLFLALVHQILVALLVADHVSLH